jgi:hypothetical protein
MVKIVEDRVDLGELLTRKHLHVAETGCPALTAAQFLTYSYPGCAGSLWYFSGTFGSGYMLTPKITLALVRRSAEL